MGGQIGVLEDRWLAGGGFRSATIAWSVELHKQQGAAEAAMRDVRLGMRDIM